MPSAENFQTTTPPGGHMALCRRKRAIDSKCALGIRDVHKCRCLQSITTSNTHTPGVKDGEVHFLTFWKMSHETGRTPITSHRTRVVHDIKTGGTLICKAASCRSRFSVCVAALNLYD